GVSARHLRRALVEALGVTPIELAQSQRLALAKHLLQETALPLTEIAFASGFGSVRRFNTLFRQRFGQPPSALRRQAATQATDSGAAEPALTLRLDYRPPLDWELMLDFLRQRAVTNLETVEGRG